jgi:hypothetical protein
MDSPFHELTALPSAFLGMDSTQEFEDLFADNHSDIEFTALRDNLSDENDTRVNDKKRRRLSSTPPPLVVTEDKNKTGSGVFPSSK